MLPDLSDYKAASEWWRLLWEKIKVEGWEFPFFKEQGDGNPIFSACHLVEKKSVRIIQLIKTSRENDEDDEAHLDYWWDLFDSIRELVIWCDSLDEEEEIWVEEIIRGWISGKTLFGSKLS